MNKEIALILANKLTGLSFVEILAGMVQTVTSSDPNSADGMSQNRYPVSTDTNIPARCQVSKEQALIPNSARKSIIYFEDFGTGPGPSRGRFKTFVSSLRLVCWFNKKKLQESALPFSATIMEANIISRLETVNPENSGIFLRMITKAVRLPIQDAGIFSRYTYKEEDRQYLRPPFDFFAIDFTVTFEVSPSCIQG